MAAHDTLSWDEIVERGKQHNKTVICEVEKRGKKRYFKVKCNICEFELFLGTSYFHSCKKCYDDRRFYTKEDFVFKSNNKHPGKYDYSLTEYINSETKVKIICNQCNTIFEQRPSCHLSGHGCPKCPKRKNCKTSNKEDFSLKSYNKHPGKYDYSLVQYINAMTKVKIKCNACNNIFMQRPNDHLSGKGCPKCNESKGEIKVARYLSDKNIKFTPQKTFQTLRNIGLLKCDFYLEDLNLLIEYDGEYHHKPVRGSTTENKQKNLEVTQRRDKIKDEWARKNNIPLLRIPYWDFDRIEELIDAFILQHTRKKEVKQLVLEM